MADPVARRTAEEWEAELGRQVRDLRLRANRTQAELASDANIAVSTLQGLERGEGSTLRTLIRVARALGRDDWLHAFAPAPQVSPMQLLRERQRGAATPRVRARPRRP